MEVVLFVSMVGLAVGISLPLFTSVMQRAQARGAGEILGITIRDARLRAISTGWQYRVVAYDSTGTVPNAFRLEGINPATGGVWPSAGTAATPPSYGTNQTYEAYTALNQEYGAAQVVVPGGTFTVTFDSLGQWATPCVPVACQVQVNTPLGVSTIIVSNSGAVQVIKP
jgi:Tfp pilus assembly protein FimT